MKNTLLILSMLLISLTSAFADFDPFNVYQYLPGRSENRPWYEWWYYKVVIPETGESFFFVYGVVNPWDKKQKMLGTRAYVGMGDFKANKQIEERFPVEQFSAAYTQTLVHVGANQATDQSLNGDLVDKNGDRYSWDISIQKDWAYNATGWATGKNITDIEWYPAQAGAHCSGSIVSHNRLFQFTDAPCYQDRNWGKDFPLWWTWIVSNHFENNPETILAIGGGRPKYLGTKFPFEGASVGLHHKGVDYHFRPNDLDYVKTNVRFGHWEVLAENATHRLEVNAFAPKEKFMDLQFMTPSGEVFHDYETLTGSLTARLYKRHLGKWKLLETLTSESAGIEYGSPKETDVFGLSSFTF